MAFFFICYNKISIMKYVFFFVPSFFSRDLCSNSIIFTRLFLVEGLSRSSHEFSLAYHQQESITVLAHQMSLRESFFFYFFLFITSRRGTFYLLMPSHPDFCFSQLDEKHRRYFTLWIHNFQIGQRAL